MTPMRNELNEYQRTAVLDDSPACLVNANVGSGKTTVLIEKILYLHNEKKIPYENVVVLTFTNKAADEIRERLAAADPGVSREETRWFGTFHGVCLSLLKTMLPVEMTGITKDFLIMLPEEEQEMAEQLIAEHELKIKYKNRLRKRLEKAMAVRDQELRVSRYQDDIFDLVDLLRQAKLAENKLSYQDLIDQTIELLPLCGAFAPEWIIIDEVQDCDATQLELLRQMKKETTHLFAVGDPNQVIYSWRGSAFNVFFTLKKEYDAKELSLPVNYRSSGSILEAAKHFLQNGGQLRGVRDYGNPIHIKNHYDSFAEADYLAGSIKELHADGLLYSDIAVFYRLTSQAKTLMDVLTREEIPFEVLQRQSLSDIPVLSWLVKLLRASLNPADESSLRAVLNHKDYGVIVGKKTKQTKRMKPFEVSELSAASEPEAYLREKISDFEDSIDHGLALTEVYDYFELDRYLHPTAQSYVDDRAAVKQFLEMMSASVMEGSCVPGAGVESSSCLHEAALSSRLRTFLNESALYGMSMSEHEIDVSEDSVKLMTLHASKGLEFTQVFIIGVNYGLIPLQSRGMEADEEERRLFFVGMTRAKDNLELSYYTSPDFVRVLPGPSRYLSMIPQRLVEDSALQKPVEIDIHARLQEIKKQIIASRGENQFLFPEVEKPADTARAGQETEDGLAQRVRHAKYGDGSIAREDENSIVVLFDDYGEKEFMRAFCQLEYLNKNQEAAE